MQDASKVPSFLTTDKESNTLSVAPTEFTEIGEYPIVLTAYYSKSYQYPNNLMVKVVKGNLPYMTEQPQDQSILRYYPG